MTVSNINNIYTGEVGFCVVKESLYAFIEFKLNIYLI